jgi:drug/metabolite transporter (DMT)-like permease
MENRSGSSTLPAFVSGLAAASIWGGMYVVSKVVLDVIPPFALLASRLVLGFLSLWLVIAFRGGFRLKTDQFWKCIGVGSVGYAVSLGFQFVGTRLSTAATGALVTSATPALVLPFAALLLKEKVTGRELAAIAIASVGVVAVVGIGSADLSSSRITGNLYLCVAAVTWALYSVLVRRIARGIDVLQASAVMLLGGLPTSLALGAGEIATRGCGTITFGIVAGVLFLGVVCTAVAMFLWNYAFARLEASTASLTFFAQPLVGAALGWLLLGERFSPRFLSGGALIILGVLVVSVKRR